MIGVRIINKEHSLFTELPKEEKELEKELKITGLDIPPQKLRLTGANDHGYKVAVFGQDFAETAICAKICRTDTLGQLNNLMQYLDNNYVDDLYDIVVDGDSESIEELYREITGTPEPETTDKLVIKAALNYKATYYEPVDCIVEKAIALTHEEFSALINIPDNCYDFIEDNREYMYFDNDNNCHCVLAYDKEKGDGLLINAEGYDYARYSAYIQNAKELAEQHDLELSGVKMIRAPITEGEKKLLDTISGVADRIATFAHLGHTDFTVEDTLKDLDCNFDDVKGMIRDAVAEKLNAKPDIASVRVSDLDIPLQPEITVTIEENEEMVADNEEISGLSL